MHSEDHSGAPSARDNLGERKVPRVGTEGGGAVDEAGRGAADGRMAQLEAMAEARRDARRGGRLCITCRHWIISSGRTAKGNPYGKCHLGPMLVKAYFDRTAGRAATETHFPRMPADEWCASWTADEDPR